MKKILSIIVVAAVMSLAATSCKEAPKESVPAAEAITESSVDPVVALCMEETSRNPIEILEKLMSQPDCPMHGPTHHVLVGAALLTAYNNCLPDSNKLNLEEALAEMRERGEQVPGGRNTPFSTDTWRLCNLMTARALEQVAENGGPRCCKRDSYLSVLTAIDFVKENLGVEMVKPEVHCTRSQINEQCIGKKCPFSPQE